MGNRLLIYHGIIDQRMTFAEVLDVCRMFLQNHLSECVVMSIKEESTALNTTRSFVETFSEATKDDGDLWHIARKFPKFGAVRQRIVPIDRVGTLGGVCWDDLDRQDLYEAPLEQTSHRLESSSCMERPQSGHSAPCQSSRFTFVALGLGGATPLRPRDCACGRKMMFKETPRLKTTRHGETVLLG